MPRVKNGVAHHARKKKIMEAAKGGFQARSKLYKAAKENVERGMRYAYRDRRKKKGDFRTLWITRINAAARLHDLSYSRLVAGLREAGALAAERIAVLGRKQGALTAALKSLPGLTPEERKRFGALANQLKQAFEEALSAREAELGAHAGKAGAPEVDLSMPGRGRWI